MEDIQDLLEKVKKYIHITWNDEDDSIKELIEEAKQYLNEKTGTAIKYKEDLVALGFLKDYCRYTRNYSKEYFEQNFLNELQNLQLKYAINEKVENSDE